ncbi:MAG TPA: YqhG family protein, partial [Halanaerobiales bacterium]|nr:YqhG family protein [Halanaerobiales bacterium]
SFIFQLSITADEREDMLRTVTIDLYKNRSVSEMGKALQKVFFNNGKSGIYPLPPLVSINKAFQTAKKSILELADEEKKNFEKRVQKYKEEELNQLKDFYAKTEKELKSRLEREELRADVDSEKQQQKTDRLAQKIEANQRDRRRRYQDIISKYTSEVEIKLSSLLYYTMPKIKTFLSIQQKQKFLELELLYNPLSYKFEDPICPLCNKEFQKIYFKNHEAVCSECAKEFSRAETD